MHRQFAPAKINLALHVVGRRADGYHLLDSLVAFADCGDRIVIEQAARDTFTVTGPYAAGVPTDEGNLVLRARNALRTRLGRQAFPVDIHLQKELPIASGIGGGSSDAAATLKALCALWNVQVAAEELATLGLALGADVPMCLQARPARVTGIGEEVEPVDTLPALPAVLVNPGVSVSTPAIFSRLQSRNNPQMPVLPGWGDVNAWLDWLRATRNDLQAPAVNVAPVITEALTALQGAGAAFTRMSGSGATCFGLFGSAEDATAAAAQLSGHSPHWYVQATTFTGSQRPS